MTLTLVIGGGGRLADGTPGELVLHRRGAIVGRAATCDWPLPDPSRHVSSRHFEVRYEGGGYQLVDHSTNGTLLAATGERLSGPHPIANGDAFQVGPYLVAARLTGAAAMPPAAAPAPAEWGGWDAPAPDAGPAAPSAEMPGTGWDPAPSSGWDSPAASPAGGAWQPRTGPALARPDPHRVAAAGWDAPAAATSRPAAGGWVPEAAITPPPVRSTWQDEAPVAAAASDWSSAAPDRAPPPSPDDLWGRIAEGNVVDWARGGFGQPAEPARDPLGLDRPSGAASLPSQPPPPPDRSARAMEAPKGAWQGSSQPAPTQPGQSGRSSPAPAADAFARAAGLPAEGADDLLPRAGDLFRQLVAGLVVMLEARARAKAQLGAEATAFSPDGHNPLKFARTPDDAVQMLLGPSQQPGFMPPARAVEDAFRELQSHQVATLRAMQGALRATLDRFSPAAIRARADAAGMIERIVPAARDAALWQAYEREFGGVAQGSDEAFLDVFAGEFRRAYNDLAAGQGKGSGR